MTTDPYIVSNAEICHGQPCFRGTRVLVSSVLEMLEAEQTYEQIIEAYPGLTTKHIQAALHLASQIIQGEHYIPFQAA